MMMPRQFLALALVAAGFAVGPSPAQATPPDVIDIREEPFGLSETHLFVIRTSTDNLGRYQASRVESFLVAIELATHKEEMWVLDRLVHMEDFSNEGDATRYMITRDPDLEAVNPYAILAQRGALPWGAVSIDGLLDAVPPVTSDAGSMSVTLADGATFRLTNERLALRLRDVTTAMAENVADYPRMATISTRAMFAERSVPVETCNPVRMLEHWEPGYPQRNRFVRIDCTDEEEIGVTSLILRMDHVAGTVPER